MARQGRDFIGRGLPGQNAIAAVGPVAERLEDGSWSPLGDARSLFPPNGCLEVRGLAASSMRDTDWFVFSAVQNDRHGAAMRFRAASPRRLARFLDIPDGETPESRRRLIIEIGLETGAAGDWAVRISNDEIVRLTLSQDDRDHRWRGIGDRHLRSLAVRRFDPALVISVPDDPDHIVLYDYETAEQLGRYESWLSDAEYLRALSAAISAAGESDAAKAVHALAVRSERMGSGASVIHGLNPDIVVDIVRRDVLAARLKEDNEALDMVVRAVLKNPTVQEALDRIAAAKSAAEMPALEAAARTKIKTEAQADIAKWVQQAKAAVAELEAEELAALEQRRATNAAKLEVFAAETRAKALADIEAEVGDARERAQKELTALDERLRLNVEACAFLEEQRERLGHAIAEMTERETALVNKVEMLARAEQTLSSRTSKSYGHPHLAVHAAEVKLQLAKVEAAASELRILTPRGIEAIVRLAVLFAAREVPVLRGRAAADLVEAATALFAGGRTARLYAEPTLVTYEDLWSRVGGNGLTVLGTAASWTAEPGNAPALGYVSDAERSAARFWYPPLADAKHRGLLPTNLMLCVGVEDEGAEEAELLFKNSVVFEAESLFDANATALTPHVFARLAREPTSLELPAVTVDPSVAALVLMNHGTGLSVAAALRLARVHAAALLALDEERATAFAAEFARTLSRSSEGAHPSDSPVVVSLAAHA